MPLCRRSRPGYPGRLTYQAVDIGLHFGNRVLVVLGGGHFQKVGGVARAGLETLQGVNDRLQRGALPTQLLGAGGIVPDAGLCEFELYLGQALLAIGKVKDTP